MAGVQTHTPILKPVDGDKQRDRAQGKNTNFTDMQFHTSKDLENASSCDSSEEEQTDDPRNEWLHGDGGKQMQKRVLVGIFQQKALHRLARKTWPAQVFKLRRDISTWLTEPAFRQVYPPLKDPENPSVEG